MMHNSANNVAAKMSGILPRLISGVQLEFFSDTSISNSQFIVLMVMYQHGSLNMHELAEKLNIAMPTATGLITRLYRKRYVRRLRDTHDRRKVLVELTPAGQKMVLNFKNIAHKRWKSILIKLEQTHLDKFGEVLDVISKTLNI
ncbi:MAG: MarR family transcriptional regulator [Candidatus Omnitrophota bacterium]